MTETYPLIQDEKWYTITWYNDKGTKLQSVCTYEKLPHYVEVFMIKNVRVSIS